MHILRFILSHCAKVNVYSDLFKIRGVDYCGNQLLLLYYHLVPFHSHAYHALLCPNETILD